MVLTVAAIAYLLMITMYVNTWNANAIKLKKENNYDIGQSAKCIIVAVGWDKFSYIFPYLLCYLHFILLSI